MSADRYDILFEPVVIGPKTAPNRFWQTPHASGFGTEYPDMQAAYRGMKAEGGWGVVFTEATSVAPETDKGPYVLGRLWDQGDVRNSRRIVERIHAGGALAGVELEYHASMSVAAEGRLVAHAVDPVAGEGTLPIGYAGTAAAIHASEIARIQDLHVQAALRAVAAGYDLITLHCGHAASLISHFLIPYYNTRTDAYGGSFENRARFARETLTKVRAAVGDRAAVGMRFGVDTLDAPLGLGDRGMRHNGEAPQVLQYLDDVVDYWDLIIGGVDWGQDAQSSRTARENHEAPFTGRMKQYTAKPVVNVGRFNSPDTMVGVVKSGQADFIGAARAGISDPFLPAKIRDGAIEDIRECIGCNMCVSRANMANGRIVCTQNPTIGEEFRRAWHPESFETARNRDQAVLVVGAGPAGLECAMVLGKRGFDMVHLVDAAEEVGGSLNWITKLPGRQEWRHLVEYREHQLSKLKNVTTILGTRLSAGDILDYGAEIVVVATGSHYAADAVSPYNRRPLPLNGSFRGNVLTPEEVMSGEATIGHRVLIWDTDGYFVGPGIAEHLAAHGHEVTAVTPATAFGPYLHHTMEDARMTEDLRALGVRVFPSSGLSRIDADTIAIETLAGPVEVGIDTVVVVGQRVAESDLYRELQERDAEWPAAGLRNVYRIGDSLRPSFIADAVFSGHRLAREIDSPNPDEPQPYIRERRLLNATETDFTFTGPAQSRTL
ncbi:FAD-dependent oxidoreductase [Streptomyces phaeochromogenes]|uniref:oxidoreductase n=1 Tax=Streptomyces phaeochromogenes TaxID=1923 RepID=UPI00386D9CA8|nr:NAD(P)-binding protein [Streptomyces phaeochromogenes]